MRVHRQNKVDLFAMKHIERRRAKYVLEVVCMCCSSHWNREKSQTERDVSQ